MAVSELTRSRLATALGSWFSSDEIADRLDPITNVGGVVTVASTGDLTLSTGALKTIVLSQPVYEDLRVSLTSGAKGASKVPGFDAFLTNGSGSQGVFAYKFDAGTEEELFFNIQFPHGKKLGTAVHPHIHWSPVSNGSAGQVVAWGMEYTWVNIGGTYPVTQFLSENVHYPADASLVASKHYMTDLGDLTLANESVSSILCCRLFRDAAGTLKTDSYGADAVGLYIDFHYQIDTLGSREEISK